jgi:hypothetical protein
MLLEGFSPNSKLRMTLTLVFARVCIEPSNPSTNTRKYPIIAEHLYGILAQAVENKGLAIFPWLPVLYPSIPLILKGLVGSVLPCKFSMV